MARTKVRHEPADAVRRVAGAGGLTANRGCVGAAGNLAVVAATGAIRFLGVPLATVALNEAVTVVRHKKVQVQYSASATLGDPLVISTADGQFAPAGITPDARTIVGRAEQDMAAAGLGWAYIF